MSDTALDTSKGMIETESVTQHPGRQRRSVSFAQRVFRREATAKELNQAATNPGFEIDLKGRKR